MKLKLLKITPHHKKENCVYIDIEIEDYFMKIKGIRFKVDPKTGHCQIGMPTLPRDGGNRYSFFIITNDEVKKEFDKGIRALMLPLIGQPIKVEEEALV